MTAAASRRNRIAQHAQEVPFIDFQREAELRVTSEIRIRVSPSFGQRPFPRDFPDSLLVASFTQTVPGTLPLGIFVFSDANEKILSTTSEAAFASHFRDTVCIYKSDPLRSGRNFQDKLQMAPCLPVAAALSFLFSV